MRRVLAALGAIHHEETARCVTAERAVLLGLGGGRLGGALGQSLARWATCPEHIPVWST